MPRKSLRKPTRPRSKYAKRRLRKIRKLTKRSQKPRKGRSEGAEALPDALLPRLEFRVPDRGAKRLRGDPERAIANEDRRAMTVVDVYDEEAGDASTGTRPCFYPPHNPHCPGPIRPPKRRSKLCPRTQDEYSFPSTDRDHHMRG